MCLDEIALALVTRLHCIPTVHLYASLTNTYVHPVGFKEDAMFLKQELNCYWYGERKHLSSMLNLLGPDS